MKNRIFKFRVWDGRNFYYPSYNLQVSNSGPCGDACIVQGLDNCSYIEDDVIIQQFTGLFDKNGKEIYEGDIVKYKGKSNLTYNKPGEVSIGEYFTHAKEFYHYGVRVKRIDMDGYFGLSSRESKDYEVIGNIFQNKELLN